MANAVPRDDNFVPRFGYDFDESVNKVAGLVWNTSTLQWEKMSQPVLEVTTSNLYLALDTVEAKLQTLIVQKFGKLVLLVLRVLRCKWMSLVRSPQGQTISET